MLKALIGLFKVMRRKRRLYVVRRSKVQLRAGNTKVVYWYEPFRRPRWTKNLFTPKR